MQNPDDPGPPPRWYGTSLVGLPAHLLASTGFNAEPRDLSIAGVREAHPRLFSALPKCPSQGEARELFVNYLTETFALRRPPPDMASDAPLADLRRWRSSWRKLLQGWGMDANGPAGAVLKGWVESRFGLMPGYHQAPLQRYPSPAWMTYLEQKADARYRGNQILQQIDLLYEFCQWSLRRFPPAGSLPGARHLRLWRGSTRCEEQVVAGRLQQRHCTVRLNSLVSFSLSRDEADCFGDWVFEAQVPFSKLLVYPGLLPGQVLQGEQEVLALGGDYEVVARYV